MVIAAAMLRSQELCLLADKAGAPSQFVVASLRDLAERACAQARGGSLDADALVRETEPEKVREAVVAALREMDAAGDTLDGERGRLEQMIRKHAQIVARDRTARKQAGAPRVPRSRSE